MESPRAATCQVHQQQVLLGFQLGDALPGVLDQVELLAGFLFEGQHGWDIRAVLALESVQQLEALLHHFQPARVGLDRLQVGAQASPQLGGGIGEELRLFGQRTLRWIHAGERTQRTGRPARKDR